MWNINDFMEDCGAIDRSKIGTIIIDGLKHEAFRYQKLNIDKMSEFCELDRWIYKNKITFNIEVLVDGKVCLFGSGKIPALDTAVITMKHVLSWDKTQAVRLISSIESISDWITK